LPQGLELLEFVGLRALLVAPFSMRMLAVRIERDGRRHEESAQRKKRTPAFEEVVGGKSRGE
jgi:hypothetical protein